ncbi:cadherin domain-containing protein [Microvirga pakistanensis]|uniref:cadherin domain-containing protein n=1 Tax=Microvirga pakistanensis TaxID=1682650 RepID=UPI00106CDE50|nr:cadherin domain-containing protein [Microvirga pakistanensis]
MTKPIAANDLKPLLQVASGSELLPLGDGSFLAVLKHARKSESGRTVHQFVGQITGADGIAKPGHAPFLIAEEKGRFVAYSGAAQSDDGRIVVAWTSDAKKGAPILKARALDIHSKAVTPAVTVEKADPSRSALELAADALARIALTGTFKAVSFDVSDASSSLPRADAGSSDPVAANNFAASSEPAALDTSSAGTFTEGGEIQANALPVIINGDGSSETIDMWSNGNNSIYVINGNGGDDFIRGGNNSIGDTIDGGAGNDTIFGGNGPDRLIGGSEFDTLDYDFASVGSILVNFSDMSRLFRTDGGTTVQVAAWHIRDSTPTGNQDDVDAATFEKIIGTKSNDQFYADESAHTPTNWTWLGGRGNDIMQAAAGHDTLEGGEGNDTLIGGRGNDSLTGGPFNEGTDILYGGDGNDTLIGGYGDTLIGGDGNNYFNAIGSVLYYRDIDVGGVPYIDPGYARTVDLRIGQIRNGQYTDTINGTAAVYTGNGNDTLYGSAFIGAYFDAGGGNDELHGSEVNDTLYGGAGYDVFFGSSGNDSIYGGADANVVDYQRLSGPISLNLGTSWVEKYINNGRSLDQLFEIRDAAGTGHNDTLVGSTDNNVLVGYDGNDRLEGLDGNDTLIGSYGDDTVDGGTGADLMRENRGNDHYWVDNVGDRIVADEDEGVDTVHIWGNDIKSHVLDVFIEHGTIETTNGIALTGNTQLANYLTGHRGNDTLKGSVGVDGRGDTMEGGDGDDTYYVYDITDDTREFNGTAGGIDTAYINVNYYDARKLANIENYKLADGFVLNHAPGTVTVQPGSPLQSDENMVNVVATLHSENPEGGPGPLVYDVLTHADKFAVVNGNQLRLLNPVDFETDPGLLLDGNRKYFSVQVRARENGQGGLESGVTTLKVYINDINEAPRDLALSNSKIDENSVQGTLIGTVSATDQDAGSTLKYSIVNDPDSKFVINENTGELRLRQGATLDYETKRFHEVKVKVTDNLGASTERQFTINVNDLNPEPNHAPSSLALSNNRIGEHKIAGDLVGTLSAYDQDGSDRLAYTIVNDPDSKFVIVNGNELRLRAGLDYETKQSHQVTVKVTDSAGGTYEQVFTVNVDNANDAPNAPTWSNDSKSLPAVKENTAFSAQLKAIDPDGTTSFTWEFDPARGGATGAASANGLFVINPNTGLVTLASGKPLDYENSVNGQYKIYVRVKDSEFYSAVQELTINVTNANDAPTDIMLSKSSVAEDKPGGWVIGTLKATDQDAVDTFTYKITEDLDSKFEIANGNELRLRAGLDYETKQSHQVKVLVTDGAGATFERMLTVNVDNVNEAPNAPSWEIGGPVEENTNGQTIAVFSDSYDPEGHEIAYAFHDSVPQALRDKFTLSTNPDGSGALVLTNLNGLDYESATDDGNGNRYYLLKIVSRDIEGAASQPVDIKVYINDVNEAPVLSTDNATVSIGELANNGAVLATFAVADQDANEQFVYTLTGYPPGMEGAFRVDATDPSNLKIVVADSTKLGVVNNRTFALTLTVKDKNGAQGVHLTDTLDFTVTINNEADRAPGNIRLHGDPVPENTEAGWEIANLDAIDPDGEPITRFDLVDTNVPFRIGQVNGLWYVITDGPLDYENAPGSDGIEGGQRWYDLRVTATAGGLTSEPQTVRIYITNEDDAPVINIDAGGRTVWDVLDTDLPSPFQHLSVFDEDTDPATGTVTVRITLDDPSSGELLNFIPWVDYTYNPQHGIYTVTGTMQQVNDAIRALQFNPADQMEGAPPRSTGFTIRVTDDDGLSSNPLVVTVNATPGNQAPTLTVLDGQSSFNAFDNGPAVNPFVGLDLGDAEGNQITLVISFRDDDGTLGLPSGGNVIVTDNGTDNGLRSFQFTGSAANLEDFLDHVTFDPRNDSASQGSVTTQFNVMLWDDYHSGTIYRNAVRVVTSHGNGNRAPRITDVSAVGLGREEGGLIVVDENVGIATIFDVDAEDGDGDPIEYALANTYNGAFSIDAEGTVSVNTALLGRILQTRDFPIEVRVSDNNGGMTVHQLVVRVRDLPNEAPVITNVSAEGSGTMGTEGNEAGKILVNENAGSVLIGDVDAMDPNDDPISYALLTTHNGAFSMDQTTGELRINTDRLPPIAYDRDFELTFQVADDMGGVRRDTITVRVKNNVNEAPRDITLSNNTIMENSLGGTVIGVLGAVDDGPAGELTFELQDPSGKFEIVPSGTQWVLRLKENAYVDYEDDAGNVFNVVVTVRDRNGGPGSQSRTETFTIEVQNQDPEVNDPPQNLRLENATQVVIDENTSFSGTLTAYDRNGDDLTFRFAANGGTTDPRGLFKIVDNQLQIVSPSGLDYETADDLGNGIRGYRVEVEVSDGRDGTTREIFTIVVEDDEEEGNLPPTDLTISNNWVREWAFNGATIGSLAPVDPDGSSGPYSFKFVLGTDGAGNPILSDQDADGRFIIVGNELKVLDGTKIDFEAARSHQFVIQVSDASGAFQKEMSIVVRDWLNENGSGRPVGETLKGGAGDDIFDAGNGNDVIYGGYGFDDLTGGEGQDAFVFNTDPINGEFDMIQDFAAGEDKTHLGADNFQLWGLEGGELTDEVFVVGSAATLDSHRIIYDAETGTLYYDEDGSGAAEAAMIAIFANQVSLNKSDFLVI